MTWHFRACLLLLSTCIPASLICQPCCGKDLVIKAHPGGSLSVAFSPDGKQLATGGSHGRVRIFGVEGFGMIGEVKIWDAATGNKISELPGLKAAVEAVAYSPDGKYLAAGCGGNDEDGKDYTVYVWEVAGYKLKHKLPLPGPPTAVAFSPDSKLLAAGIGQGSKQEVACIWDVETAKELHTIRREGLRGYRRIAIAFAPDNKSLAIERSVGALISALGIWNLSTGQLQNTIPGNGNSECVAYSPDGKILASGRPQADISLIAMPDGKLLRTLQGHQLDNLGGVWTLAFSPNGELLASGGTDHDIRLWSMVGPAAKEKAQKDARVLRGHTALVRAVAFSPDGKRLASASNDLAVRVWDIAEKGVN